jgi:hypothetical protein
VVSKCIKKYETIKTIIMKNSKTIWFLAIILIAASCSKDGVDGAPGKDGSNLSNNTGFDVTNNAGQVVNTSTITPVTFNTKITDDANAFNTSTSEWKIPSTGFYNINAKVSFLNNFPVNTTGVIYIYKNGVLFKEIGQTVNVSPGLSISTNTNLIQNDVIKVYVLHNSLTSNALKLGVANCSFSGYRVY